MSKVSKPEIKETAQTLLALSRKLKNPLAQARLRVFYLYQTGQARDYSSLARQVGYERHAIGKWFSLYREHGLMHCLKVDQGGHPVGSVICGKALEELKAKLSDERNYFTSYTQIPQWLLEQHGIALSYKHVHYFVRYILGAKLKVVRKSNLKKDPVLEAKFKKKSALS